MPCQHNNHHFMNPFATSATARHLVVPCGSVDARPSCCATNVSKSLGARRPKELEQVTVIGEIELLLLQFRQPAIVVDSSTSGELRRNSTHPKHPEAALAHLVARASDNIGPE
uniref:Uncharacterized protein n=1 Tax=Oryza punctata TaxID=4537 RepID=A0A0E0MM59_ORYPU